MINNIKVDFVKLCERSERLLTTEERTDASHKKKHRHSSLFLSSIMTTTLMMMCCPSKPLSSDTTTTTTKNNIKNNNNSSLRRRILRTTTRRRRTRIGDSSSSSSPVSSLDDVENDDDENKKGDDANTNPFASALFAGTLCCIFGVTTFAADVRVANAVTENQLLFLEAWRAVDKAYVDKTFNGVSWFKYREQTVKNTPMPSREDAYEAIKAMLKKLDDPFTRFLEPDQYAAVSENTMNANVSGIGVELTIDSDLSVKVVTPTIDAPAYVAGIKPLDKILEIDATDVTGLSLYEVAELLRGPQGSDVLLKIEPSATPGKTKNLSVTRKQYAVVPVKSDLCTSKSGGDSIGVVKLQTFNSLSAAKTKEALSDLAAKGANSFVLDLRDDSGGLFPGALDIASQLMKKGLIVQIADAEGVRDTFEVNGKPLENVYDKKLSVIVNKGTASASEVLTAALRDNNRATVFGDEPTYGKGLIQTIVPLSDGSAVNVTVAKYQTPLGTDINKVGIAPDKKLPVGKDGQIMPAKLDKIPSTNDADASVLSFCEYVSSLEDGTF